MSVSVGKKEEKKLTCGSTDPQLSACFRSFNSTCALVPSKQTNSSTLCGRTMSCFLPSSKMNNRWGLEGMKEIRDERIKLKDRNREGKVRESWEEGAWRAETKVNRLEKKKSGYEVKRRSAGEEVKSKGQKEMWNWSIGRGLWKILRRFIEKRPMMFESCDILTKCKYTL